MNEQPLPRFLKNIKTGLIFPYNDLLARDGNVFHACEKDGRLLNFTAYDIPERRFSPEGPAQDAEHTELLDLRDEARKLKIPGFNNAKKETLIEKIAEAKAALEPVADAPKEQVADEPAKTVETVMTVAQDPPKGVAKKKAGKKAPAKK